MKMTLRQSTASLRLFSHNETLQNIFQQSTRNGRKKLKSDLTITQFVFILTALTRKYITLVL